MITTAITLLLVFLMVRGLFSALQDGSPGAGNQAVPEGIEAATFAGGCFWCMEAPFKALDGVLKVLSGYTGGHKPDPTYTEVCSGTTGHLEAIQITFDPGKISYEQLLAVFWRQFDPTDAGGAFADRGPQYTSAVFYHSPGQKAAAEKSKSELERSGRFDKPVVTPILPAMAFYPAEDYHQDYFRKNPLRYKAYRYHSGRDRFLVKIWTRG